MSFEMTVGGLISDPARDIKVVNAGGGKEAIFHRDLVGPGWTIAISFQVMSSDEGGIISVSRIGEKDFPGEAEDARKIVREYLEVFRLLPFMMNGLKKPSEIRIKGE